MKNAEKPVPLTHMLLPAHTGDIVFHRARNGWVVTTVDDVMGEESPMTSSYVFEDPEGVMDQSESASPSAESLRTALFLAFEDHFRSKHRGGLVVRVAKHGREWEDTHEAGKE